jgi:ApbE superfamily uncharacterized protein (UPF0280 family)
MKARAKPKSKAAAFGERTYRNRVKGSGLAAFRVTVKETDLWLQAEKPLAKFTRDAIITHRQRIENYIRQHPQFQRTFTPWPDTGPMPTIVGKMVLAGQRAHTGPMAAVAGALAEAVGTDLLDHSSQVIVENGGDIFMKTDAPLTVAIFAGDSPLNLKIGLRIDSSRQPLAVCTSSGTVGHSVSLGRADAVCVVAERCPLADAAATAIGNRVGAPEDIRRALEWGRSIQGVKGVAVIVGEATGFWGEIEIVPLSLG